MTDRSDGNGNEGSSNQGKGRSGKNKRPTRKLSLASRLRDHLRNATDGILGAEVAWSVILVAVVVSMLGAQRCGTDYSSYAVGDVAPRDIRAARDGEVIDIEATESRRREAREAVTEVYVHDAERGARLGAQLSQIFTEGRRELEQLSLEGAADADAIARERLADLAPPTVLEHLIQSRFDPTLEHELKAALARVMGGMVTGNKSVLGREPAITVVRIPGEATETLQSYEAIIDVAAARRAVRDRVRQRLRGRPEALGDFLASFVDSNLNPDAEQTLRLREQREREVPTLLKRVPAGTLVVRAGDVIDADTLRVLRSLERGANRVGLGQYLAGIVLIAAMLAFFTYRYATFHQRHFRRVNHLHALMVLVLVAMLGLTQFMLWLARKVSEGLAPPFNDAASYAYLAPLAAGAILVTLLANGRIAIVYASFASFLFGMITGWDPYLALWAMVVQCAAIYAISTDRERTALIRAGFVVGTVGAVTAIALQTIRGELEPLSATFYCAALALVGGTIGIGPLTAFMLPLLERLFNVLTDVRLLELSSGNHPLLQQLAVKAPGTYNHSLVVGTLAEEAARAIGANELFCRVAAFYHDVGKMNMPEYFVENQHGSNPHDKLAPSMSALIIASHVKDGIKMAREANLPTQIVDIVPQHHGTRLMSYFYEKAKQNADPSMGTVKEEDFRYPGPKPQSREAAIFMIADGVEAAARTIDEPNANRLRDMITKITNAIVIEQQLDECDLTFADLRRIQQALLKRLVAMYHHRVDYPGFDFGNQKGSGDDTSQERELAKGS